MLTKVYRFIMAMSVVSLMGCTDNIDTPDSPQPDSPGTITIHLKNSEMSRSESSDNSEFRIDHLVIGLYSFEAYEDQPAVVWGSFDNIDKSGSYTVTLQLTDDDVKTLFDNGKDQASCRFFVLANLPDDGEISSTVPDKASIETLKNFAVSSTFATKPLQSCFVMTGEGEVIYSAPANSSVKGKASGEGTLIRAAAKINLNLKLPTEPITVNNNGTEEKWLPVTGSSEHDISVLLNNGVRSSIASPDGLFSFDVSPDGGIGWIFKPWKPEDEDAYYNSDLNDKDSYRSIAIRESGAEEEYPYTMDVPFYTYPNAWSETAEETRKTTLTLVLPWYKVEEGETQPTTFRTYYYMVPVTAADLTNITRNYSYTINLSIGMLGSTVPDQPIPLEDLTYQVVDWGREDIKTDIEDTRYLVVNPNVYTINNDSVISIPFYTSHPTEITSITMSYKRFNYPGNGSGDEVNISVSNDVIDNSTYTHIVDGQEVTDTICNYTIVRDPVSRQLTLKITHPMIMWVPLNRSGNPMSLTEILAPIETYEKQIVKYAYPTKDTYKLPGGERYGDKQYYTPDIAYFPYKFKVTIQHSDNEHFRESVEITQYPGMYIETDKNNGGSYMSENSSNQVREVELLNYGYTFLNARKETGEDGLEYWLNADSKWDGDRPSLNDIPREKYPLIYDSDLAEKYMSANTVALGGLRAYPGASTGDAVTNPNMYIVNITQLSENDQEYIIGDPRSASVNNNLDTPYDVTFADGNKTSYIVETGNLGEDVKDAEDWCQIATSLYDGPKRRLRYYYPTDESDRTKMMVAPKLRVSSAFGYVRDQVEIISRTIGRRRAATYQEQGFPAGRWRLPTYGEVKFIVELSATKKIPTLFAPGMKYLTAQGIVLVEADEDDICTGEVTFLDEGIEFGFWYQTTGSQPGWKPRSSNGVNVRPVYDEWYWEKQSGYVLEKGEDGGYIYTLGDMPMKSN